MSLRKYSVKLKVCATAALSLGLLATLTPTVSVATGLLVSRNTSPYVTTARNLGSADPSKVVEVSIWLRLHDRAGLDSLARQIYDRTSPRYRHFLNRDQVAARFAPTAEEAGTVRKFFESHNMTVVRTGPDNLYVRARGTVSDVQSAFHVALNTYQVGDEAFRSNDRDPYIDGDAAPLVSAVIGLDSGEYQHPVAVRANIIPGTNASAAEIAQTTVLESESASAAFSSQCFDGVVEQTFSTETGGPFPMGVYKGGHLNAPSATTFGCAYTPSVIQTAYRLTGLYEEGYTGEGQTIGIINPCGAATVLSDTNAFSARFGLRPLTAATFTTTNTAPNTCENPGGDLEINLDVEWAHAVAPGARINLIVTPSLSINDIGEAELDAIIYRWADVLSGSFGMPESQVPETQIQTVNLINELAAVTGVSANFASGDSGDFSRRGISPTVSVPADSPWATAVGGVTLALSPNNSIRWQAGWGNDATILAEPGFVLNPPLHLGNISGSGGGASNCASQDSSGRCLAGFPKPSYQRSLPGQYRQLPDISWLADPNTPVVIALTEAVPGADSTLVYVPVGGTSLACPMFSALWAIANQESETSGNGPLGQAAQYLYSMPAGTVDDIVPQGNANDPTSVTATIQESTTSGSSFTAAQLLGIAPTSRFRSVIWNQFASGTALALSFGNDTSLEVSVGWDDVTGVGTPNAKAFADSFGVHR